MAEGRKWRQRGAEVPGCKELIDAIPGDNNGEGTDGPLQPTAGKKTGKRQLVGTLSISCRPEGLTADED